MDDGGARGLAWRAKTCLPHRQPKEVCSEKFLPRFGQGIPRQMARTPSYPGRNWWGWFRWTGYKSKKRQIRQGEVLSCYEWNIGWRQFCSALLLGIQTIRELWVPMVGLTRSWRSSRSHSQESSRPGRPIMLWHTKVNGNLTSTRRGQRTRRNGWPSIRKRSQRKPDLRLWSSLWKESLTKRMMTWKSAARSTKSLKCRLC